VGTSEQLGLHDVSGPGQKEQREHQATRRHGDGSAAPGEFSRDLLGPPWSAATRPRQNAAGQPASPVVEVEHVGLAAVQRHHPLNHRAD
jgi:hypothetical protein